MAALFSPAELSFTAAALSSTAVPSPSSSLLLENVLRSDARTPLAFRDITLQTHVSSTSLGSAKVSVESIGGSTEIWAGVRGEVEDISASAAQSGGEGTGKIVVSVECSPTALQSLVPDLTLHLASLLSHLFSSSLPGSYLTSLLVIPRVKAWTLYLDVLILASAGGNVLDLALMAARTALAVTRVPATRSIGYEKGEVEVGAELQEKSGFSGLVKGGKGGVNAVDFELTEEEAVRLSGWEQLPVGLTLNLINQLPYLDATAVEERATAAQIVFCFTSSGDLAGIKQLGEGEVEFGRLLPLVKEARTLASDLISVLNSKSI